MKVLVLNTGSSSVKYRLFDGSTPLAKGLVEKIGEAGGDAADHTAALRSIMDEIDLDGLGAVGHRVVHGGSEFARATVIDDEVVAAIERLIPLAPLHNPAALAGIAVARKLLPDVPQVAVFDTAFHATIPPEGTTWAIDAGAGRALADPAVRLPRHLPRVRGPADRRAAGPAAGAGQRDHPAPGQRRQRLRGPGRPQRRHVDGHVAAGRPGDGHPQRRHRPDRGVPPAPGGRAADRGDRELADPARRPARAGRRQRHASGQRAPRLPATRPPRWRSTSTAGGSASTSAPTWRCSAGWTRSPSPPGSGENSPAVRAAALSGLAALGIDDRRAAATQAGEDDHLAGRQPGHGVRGADRRGAGDRRPVPDGAAKARG